MTKQHWLDAADVIDRLRVGPIVMLAFYGLFVYDVFEWIKSLDELTNQATGLFTAVLGVSTAVFGFYIKLITHKDKKGVD